MRIINYGKPVDLSGWGVVLHGRTNGQSRAESFQTVGYAGISSDAAAAAAGWVSVSVDVDAWWPADTDAGSWALVTSNPVTSVRITRAEGPLTVRGTAAADARAPLPAGVADTLRAEIAAATNALTATIQEGGGGSATNALPLVGGIMDAGAEIKIPAKSGSASNVFSSAGMRLTNPQSPLRDSFYGLESMWVSEAGTGGGRVRVWPWGLAYRDPATSREALWSFPAVSGLGESRQFASTDHVSVRLDAATNHLVQTYLLNSNAWLSVSNETLRVHSVTGGVASASVIWESSGGSGESIDPQATNLLWHALAQANAAIAGKAPKAWGAYAPDGTDNPDPDFMTFLNAPSVVFAGGATWAASGAYAVLVADGAVAFAAGASGELRIGPDLATNWFGYRQGGSVLVGARADSLAIHDAGTTNGYAQILYDYEDGDFPTMWFTPTLALDFVQVDAVWVANTNGTATATVPAQAARGFYRATTTASFSSYFVSTMPAIFEGGVLGGTNALPVIYDSVITVTSGGKTYRIPAQEVK